MKSKRYAFFMMVLLFVFPGNVSGEDSPLTVSAKEGLVSISSSNSTLSEILARLSQELDFAIRAEGVPGSRVVSCEIEGSGIAEALQKLVPEWNSLLFSKDERSIEIRTDGHEETGVPQKEGGMADGPAGAASDSSSTEEEREGSAGQEIAPSDEVEGNDSIKAEISGEENRDDSVVTDQPAEDHLEDDGAAEGPETNQGKGRSSRRGSWRLW